jgi:hypothetical protein
MRAALVLSLALLPLLLRTLAMNHSIREVRMKRQWRVRRQFQPTTDAERRWDQAYQHLLSWNQSERTGFALLPPFRCPANAEVRDENSNICAGIDEPAEPGANH